MDRAIELLTQMGAGLEDFPALLGKAAECMRMIRHEFPIGTEDLDALGPYIRRVQRKNLLAEELLNRAATFYCGWLAAGNTNGGGYIPGMADNSNSGRVLVMDA